MVEVHFQVGRGGRRIDNVQIDESDAEGLAQLQVTGGRLEANQARSPCSFCNGSGQRVIVGRNDDATGQQIDPNLNLITLRELCPAGLFFPRLCQFRQLLSYQVLVLGIGLKKSLADRTFIW